MPLRTECRCVRMEDMPSTVPSMDAIADDEPGFIVAPFAAAESAPIVLIRCDVPDIFQSADNIPAGFSKKLDAVCAANSIGGDTLSPAKSDYARDFAVFHSRLADGTFDKLVLSRKMCVRLTEPISPTVLFAEACRRYPRCFIALFSTPVSGSWLVATPELLLEKNGDKYHTMALAGTMEYTGNPDPDWSTKNIREQRYVADYIRDAISPYACDVATDGPRTVRAAGLVHLRTDFTFHINRSCRIGLILQSIHPTPAVCGLPAEAAKSFIIASEHSARDYYSGFCGPVGIDGATSLYVALRCMRLRAEACDLFAGGGLLSDSTENSEWQETEAKMRTMLNLLEK